MGSDNKDGALINGMRPFSDSTLQAASVSGSAKYRADDGVHSCEGDSLSSPQRDVTGSHYGK